MPSKIISSPVLPEGYRPRFAIPKRMAHLRDPMFDLCSSPPRVVVEVGSQWGWWAHRAARQLDHARIYCVDPWSVKPTAVAHYKGGEENLHDWCHNVGPWLGDRLLGIRGTTEEVAPYFNEEIDLIFIDGDHTEEGVFKDLELWIPKMAKGGLAVGHDWNGPWSGGVRRAVRRYFGTHKINVGPIYWSMQGRELSPCWYRRF